MLFQLKETKTGHKERNGSAWIQAGLVLLLGLLSLWPVFKTGYPILEKEGLEYWANARVLLGEEYWRNYLIPAGTTSYGYSLLIALGGCLIENEIHLYKILMAVNVFFWMVDYCLLVKLSRKMTEKIDFHNHEMVCFLVLMLPVCVDAKLLIGPGAIFLCVLLLLMIRVNAICTAGEIIKSDLWITVILLMTGTFMHSTMIAVAAALLVIFGWQVYQKKWSAYPVVAWGTSAFSGILVIGILEQIIGHLIWDTQMQHSSGVTYVADEILANFDQNGLIGILESAFGISFSLLTGTILLVLPGLWWLGKKGYEDWKKEKKVLSVEVCILLAAVFSFLLEAMRNTSEIVTTALMEDDIVWILFLPVALCGFYYINELKKWQGKAVLWVCIGAVSAGFCSDYLKGHSGLEFRKAFSGIIPLFEEFSHKTENTPVLIMAILLLFAVSAFCFYELAKEKQHKWLSGFVGMCFCLGLLYFQYEMYETFFFVEQGQKKEYKKMAQKMDQWDGNVLSSHEETEGWTVQPLIQSQTEKEILYCEEKIETPAEWKEVMTGYFQQGEKPAVLLEKEQMWMMDEIPAYHMEVKGEKAVLYLPDDSKAGAEKQKVLVGEEGKKEIEKLIQISTLIKPDSSLAYVVGEKQKRKKEYDFSFLEKRGTKNRFAVTTIEELLSGREEDWILTEGYTGRNAALLEKYTLVALEGDYGLLMNQRLLSLGEETNDTGKNLSVKEKWQTALERREEQQSEE